tara:strand:+ start:433 stop:660 length:228 start_codon:yes stop_codon:yes gene_type:complete
MQERSSTYTLLVFNLTKDQIVLVSNLIDHNLAQEILHQDGERSLPHAYRREEFMNKVAAQFLDLYPNETIEEYYP